MKHKGILILLLIMSLSGANVVSLNSNTFANKSPFGINEPTTDKILNNNNLNNPIQLDSHTKGTVVIDNSHGNDYLPNDLASAQRNLTNMGFLTYLSSELGGLQSSLQYADYLIVTTPTQNFTTSQKQAIADWFKGGARNLILSSRGDFGDYNLATINNLLTYLNSSIQVQDDNVYTTNPSVPDRWYVYTDNMQTSAGNQFFEGVSEAQLFSPSSLRFTDANQGDILINGTSRSYQTDQNPPAPSVIYDNTDDDTGGEIIPLVAHENISSGPEMDRLLVSGTTMWSDFDYAEYGNFDNARFFENVMNYFSSATRNIIGDFEITVPDPLLPGIEITFPRNNSIVKDTITVTSEMPSHFDSKTTQFYIDDELKANSFNYTWDTTSYSAGKHNITIAASDAEGKTYQTSHFYTVNQSYTPTNDKRIKFMTYNIKESGINSGWLEVLKEENADVIALIETGTWDDNNNQKLNHVIDELNSYFIDKVNYKGYTDQNAPTPYTGIAILSRYPIVNTTELVDLQLDDGSTFDPAHDIIEAVIDVKGTKTRVIASHLKCCEEGITQREKEQEGINNYIDNIDPSVPIIYAGDLNSHSPVDGDQGLGTEPVDSVINPSDEQAPKNHQFYDVHHLLNPKKPGYTFPSYESRIDFIFVNQVLNDTLISSTTGDTKSAQVGSDHFSVDAILDLSEKSDKGTRSGGTTTDGDNGFLTWNMSHLLVFIPMIGVIFRLRRNQR